jgi:hypothetical protein
LAVVKLTTVQVTKLPLMHKTSKIDMICSVNPVLTEDMCVVQKQELSIFFFIVSGVGLSPLYCGHFWPIVPAPDDR